MRYMMMTVKKKELSAAAESFAKILWEKTDELLSNETKFSSSYFCVARERCVLRYARVFKSTYCTTTATTTTTTVTE